jgi:hypothetical protein
VVHALAEVMPTLQTETDLQVSEKGMRGSAMQLDRAATRRERSLNRFADEPRMQARGAPRADAWNEPRLRLPRHRGFCEHDDQR